MRKYVDLVAIFLLATFLSTSAALAANMEEGATTWIAAIFTVAGGGWIWRRTFKAADVYEIWYGTNRRDRIVNTYDNEFGNRLHYGKCKVAIPKGHVFGSIGSSPLRRWLMRLFSGSDDRLRVQKLLPCSATEFGKSIGRRLSQFGLEERAVLVFIHGYNVTFNDAAIRAAQIGFDLKIPGAMALYSWPSSGRVDGYLSDADSVAASESFLIEFIERVSNAAGEAKINIIAHSMGNLGLIRALTLGLAQQRLSHIRFGQIFLAAPDIDANLFKQLAVVYPKCSDKTTIYMSATDHALSISNWVHRNQRTGYTPPVTIVGGVDTVEATNIDVGLLGHGYYAAASALLYDIAILLRSNLPPQKRPGLYSAISEDGDQYWVMRAQAH
ncbi:alpha/beta hydrolase [Bradyrhizobium sp. Ash2021]|uniref:alpha/beta hydrolase n=1 Tax=Bradyrhizobium sp. Ash2021 TaxID=2954771 RepID=UPI002815F7AD|nr:alpha/beta hydrolase [Bradyrhizobium sp. Ash2021]WMT71112.1 alpha/beta hydrolase [Bradyrhizobium sp. Ash2021]